MSQTDFAPIFTDAGRAAIADSSGRGLSAIISHIALGTGRYDVRGEDSLALPAALTRTALVDERLRVPVSAGDTPAPGSISLLAEIAAAANDTEEFFINEIGLIDDDGVLIALWSSQTHNLGHRGRLGGWSLSLVLAWIDMPADAITVNVQSVPLSRQLVAQAQISAQIRSAVEGAGLTYDEAAAGQLDAAITAKITGQLSAARSSEAGPAARVYERIRTPLALIPAPDAEDVMVRPTLTGNAFFSPDDFTHIASQFQIAIAGGDDDGDIFYDSGAPGAEGALGALTQLALSEEAALSLSASYKWRLRYSGRLEGRTAISAWSDWAAFATGVPHIAAPGILSPEKAATGIGETPTFEANEFAAHHGTDSHGKSQWQIARDVDFDDVVIDSEVTGGDLTQLTVPENRISTNTQYHVRVRYFGAAMEWSDWSAAVSFTTRASFNYVRVPTINAPAEGAEVAYKYPLIELGAFALNGDVADTHQATKIQIRTANGDWQTPFHDSGALGAVTQYRLPLAAPLSPDTSYVIRARHEGSDLGWGDWSAPRHITTATTLMAVARPSITSPAANATINDLTPAFTWSAFAVTGGHTDTHQASQLQIKTAMGDWDAPTYDSGLPGAAGALGAVTSHSLPAASTLISDMDYVLRLRMKGMTSGWSEWSEEIAFHVVEPIGEAIFTVPGRHDWIVPAGVTSVHVVCIGGGGSGVWHGSGSGGGGDGGGGGGALRWKNDIAVTSGNPVSIHVGSGGYVREESSELSRRPSRYNGGSSSFGPFVTANGGARTGAAGGRGGDGGGNGGAAGATGGGGGGAGGYLQSGSDGLRGGGGHGDGGMGGGADIFGIIDGSGGHGGGGGSGNGPGTEGEKRNGRAGDEAQGIRNSSRRNWQFGGGGGSGLDGAFGVVRIIWGSGLSFPNNARPTSRNTIASSS